MTPKDAVKLYTILGKAFSLIKGIRIESKIQVFQTLPINQSGFFLIAVATIASPRLASQFPLFFFEESTVSTVRDGNMYLRESSMVYHYGEWFRFL